MAKKTNLKAVESNPFANPDAATQEGSEENLAALDGNEQELPEGAGDETDADPQADAARERLKNALKAQDDSFWDNAKDMAYIANKKSYQAWGHKTFEAFVDAEFGIAKRKAQYYVQVHNYFESAIPVLLKDKPKQHKALMKAIREAGWVKGRVLAREQIITADNVEEVISKVKESGYRDLETFCKMTKSSMTDEQREKSGSDDNPTVRVSFQVTPPQADDMESAWKLAQTMGNGGAPMSKSSAIAYVAKHFLTMFTASQGKGSEEQLVELMSQTESLFKKSIIVIDDETKQVVYGAEALEKLSAG